MTTTALRQTTITFTGDVKAVIPANAPENAASPGQTDIVTLASGANTITPPTGGSTPKSVTIIPPTGNLNLITLKGIAGDTGVVLHLTEPSTIALNNPASTFVLNAAAITTGVRLIWA